MWKKVIAIVVVIAAALGLAAWGMGPKPIATTNAGVISKNAYYNSLKATPQGQQTLANMVIQKVLVKKYKGYVDDKAVQASFDSVKKGYSNQFSAALASQGLTESTFHESLYLQALEKAAVKHHEKFTTAELKKEYKDYTPNVKVSIIATANEDNAKKIIDQLNDGKDFAKLAKSDSVDASTKANGGHMPAFDSTSTSVDTNLQKAAFGLKAGEYTKTPVKGTDGTYYVVKLDSKADKKSFSALRSKMEDILVTKDMSDSSKVQGIVGEELASANVNIKDSTLKNALSQYTEAAAAMQASSTKAKKSSSDNSSSASSKSTTSSSSSSTAESSSSSAK